LLLSSFTRFCGRSIVSKTIKIWCPL